MRKQSLNIEVVADTKILTAKLKAIAKHAEALADELEEIDNSVECPECGSIMDIETIFADNKVVFRTYKCDSCGIALDSGNNA